MTYKALEQLNESGFDLVKVEAVVKKTRHSQNLESLLVTDNGTPSTEPSSTCPIETVTRELATKGTEKWLLKNKLYNMIFRCKNETGCYCVT